MKLGLESSSRSDVSSPAVWNEPGTPQRKRLIKSAFGVGYVAFDSDGWTWHGDRTRAVRFDSHAEAARAIALLNIKIGAATIVKVRA